jgi:hypothetical protein
MYFCSTPASACGRRLVLCMNPNWYDFFTIFDEIMEKPVTNAKLETMLTSYKKPKPTDPKPIPMKIKVAGFQSTKSYFEEKIGMYTKNNHQTLAEELIPISNQR